VAICFQLSLTVEVEAWIVIHPADQIDARRVPDDKQVSRIRTMRAVGCLCLIRRSFRHQHGEVSVFRSKPHPTTTIGHVGGGSVTRSAGWTARVFLGTEGKTQAQCN